MAGQTVSRSVSKEEAKQLGLKYYFTGEPCEARHVCKRYVDTDECFVCKYNLDKGLSITTAVADIVMQEGRVLAPLKDSDTLMFEDVSHQHLDDKQMRHLAQITNRKYFTTKEPCPVCKSNKRMTRTGACLHCWIAKMKEKKAAYRRMKGLEKPNGKNDTPTEKYENIDTSVGTSQRLQRNKQATLIVAIIAHNYAGATIKTLRQNFIELKPEGNTNTISTKLNWMMNNFLVEKVGKIARATIWKPTNEFYYYYRNCIDILCAIYDGMPKYQNCIRDSFDQVLNPKPELELDPILQEQTDESSIDIVAKSVADYHTNAQQNIGDGEPQPSENIDGIKRSLVMGEAIYELINDLKSKLKNGHDKKLIEQLELKDQLIDKLKIKYNSLLSDHNHLQEKSAKTNRLLIEKHDELSQLRRQHNDMIEELQKTSRGKITMRDIARVSSDIGLTEFRDSLPAK